MVKENKRWFVKNNCHKKSFFVNLNSVSWTISKSTKRTFLLSRGQSALCRQWCTTSIQVLILFDRRKLNTCRRWFPLKIRLLKNTFVIRTAFGNLKQFMRFSYQKAPFLLFATFFKPPIFTTTALTYEIVLHWITKHFHRFWVPVQKSMR